MEYRFLGKSGLKISSISFGAWVTFGNQITDDTAYKCMEAALDAGVNFFDNAEVYAGGKAETTMGDVIKKASWKREDLVISTKIFWGGDGVNNTGLSRKHLIEGTNASLKRLQMDYVDLIFCHRPDLFTPIEETVRAMNYLINQGKAFYWGTSQWSAAQIMEAYGVARREHLIPPLMDQPEYNMFTRERVEKEYLPLYKEIGLGTTIFSPLLSGILSGKYNQGIPKDTRVTLSGYEWLKKELESDEMQRNIEKVKKLTPIAKELGCSMSQMAIAWCLKNPNVSTVITGASRSAQVQENMKSLDYVSSLTDEIIEKIEKVLDNKPKPASDYRE
jgi:voltage-dependent potassium channel beta subunit